jgi:hypothetical protein
MKKIIIVFSSVLVIAAAIFYFAPLIWKKSGNTPAAGGTPENLIIGMRNSVTYRLDDLLGRYTIVLAFLDNSVNSRKFEAACAENLLTTFKNRHDLVWLNIKKDRAHIVIEEQTKVFSLMYRTLAASIPQYYNFSRLPSVLVIDKNGIIKLLYNGYSPTIFTDIYHGLPKPAK